MTSWDELNTRVERLYQEGAYSEAKTGEELTSIARSIAKETYLNDNAWANELFQMAVLKSSRIPRTSTPMQQGHEIEKAYMYEWSYFRSLLATLWFVKH